MSHKVIFVHGFGVKRDSRGMFTDIVNALPDTECVLFDLNLTDEVGNTRVATFSQQVALLKKIMSQNKEGTVDLVCHSQGCVVACLADLPDIRRTILLAPPTDSENQTMIDYFAQNPKSVIDLDGISRIARRDGSTTYISAKYWKEKESIDMKKLYQNYLNRHETVVVQALDDEVILNKHFSDCFSGIKTFELSAGHNFENDSREKLISLVKELVA